MRGAASRLLTAAVLLGWLVAPLCALSLSLHVGEDHHHARTIDLALAGAHGHHHDAVTAEHDHPGIPRAAQLTAPLPVVFTAILSRASAQVGGVTAFLDAAPPPTGSPPLFYSHCALLL